MRCPNISFTTQEAGAKLMTAGLKMDDPEFLKTYLIRNARQLGMAGKLLFPIPERGLAGRLYRIKAKTVIVWGESDRMIPPVYGPAFTAEIAGARLVKVPEAGHMVVLEKPGAIVEAVAGIRVTQSNPLVLDFARMSVVARFAARGRPSKGALHLAALDLAGRACGAVLRQIQARRGIL